MLYDFLVLSLWAHLYFCSWLKDSSEKSRRLTVLYANFQPLLMFSAAVFISAFLIVRCLEFINAFSVFLTLEISLFLVPFPFYFILFLCPLIFTSHPCAKILLKNLFSCDLICCYLCLLKHILLASQEFILTVFVKFILVPSAKL